MDASQDKPRKLEDDIAEYLIKIELQFSSVLDNNDDEEKYNLIENVLIELSNRFASASCDKRTNFLIEKLCSEANLKQLLEIIRKVSPYSVFLARNRYSSHILQTIIGRMCYVLKYEDYGGTDASDIMEVLEVLCKPVMKEISWLMTEQSASHVLRSMMSLLSGIPIVAERKTLLALTTKEIERLIADFSSSAVLNLFIRILANPNIITTSSSSSSGPELLQRLFNISFGFHSLSYSDTVDQERHIILPETVQYVFYAMAGDRAGSYFLEGVIECSNIKFLIALVSTSLLNKCKEYISDPVGNFVVQAIFRRISSEISINNNIQSPETRKNLINVTTKLMNEIITSDYFSQMITSKGGVALWLLIVSRHLSDVSIGENIALGIINTWTTQLGITIADNPDQKPVVSVAKITMEDIDILETQSDHNLLQSISSFLSSKLINSVKDESKNISKNNKNNTNQITNNFERDATQVLIAKLTGELLRSKSTKISHFISKSLCQISSESLKYIATSGAVSRALLDVFFELFSQTTEFKLLGMNLSILGLELAQHYVGQHIVRKYFELADLRGKEKWALTLTSSGNSSILARTKEGNATLKLMNAELYQRDPTEWRSTIKRKLKAESMLKEVDSTLNNNSKQITAGNNTGNRNKSMEKQPMVLTENKVKQQQDVGADNLIKEGHEEEDGNGRAGQNLKKRKRKRPNKNNNINVEA